MAIGDKLSIFDNFYKFVHFGNFASKHYMNASKWFLTIKNNIKDLSYPSLDSY